MMKSVGGGDYWKKVYDGFRLVANPGNGCIHNKYGRNLCPSCRERFKAICIAYGIDLESIRRRYSVFVKPLPD